MKKEAKCSLPLDVCLLPAGRALSSALRPSHKVMPIHVSQGPSACYDARLKHDSAVQQSRSTISFHHSLSLTRATLTRRACLGAASQGVGQRCYAGSSSVYLCLPLLALKRTSCRSFVHERGTTKGSASAAFGGSHQYVAGVTPSDQMLHSVARCFPFQARACTDVSAIAFFCSDTLLSLSFATQARSEGFIRTHSFL